MQFWEAVSWLTSKIVQCRLPWRTASRRRRVTTKDLKQYGCITPANIDGVGLVVQGCLETIVNATYYPYCAKFRDELVAPAPAPSPVSDYELNAKGEIVVLGCAIKIEDEYDQGNNKKRKTSS